MFELLAQLLRLQLRRDRAPARLSPRYRAPAPATGGSLGRFQLGESPAARARRSLPARACSIAAARSCSSTSRRVAPFARRAMILVRAAATDAHWTNGSFPLASPPGRAQSYDARYREVVGIVYTARGTAPAAPRSPIIATHRPTKSRSTDFQADFFDHAVSVQARRSSTYAGCCAA